MDFSDYAISAAKASVASILGSDSLQKIADFAFSGHAFKKADLGLLYYEITQGALKVAVNTSLRAGAEYSAKKNTLTLGFYSADTLTRRALVVHESTHALFDFKAAKMDRGTSESIAYIVQCMYAKANSTSSDPDDRLWDEGDNDWVFDIGWRIAGKLLSGGSIDSSDEADMKQAVTKHSNYCKVYTEMADYDGI